MEIKSARERLIEVDQALSAVRLGGQSYTIGSRKLTRVEYSKLLQERKELEAQIAAEDGSGLLDDTYVAVFDGR